MKVTLERLIKSQPGLREISSIPAGKIAFDLAFDFSVALERVDLLLKLYNDLLQKLRNKYVVNDDKGNPFIPAKFEKEFMDQVRSVENKEFDISFPVCSKDRFKADDKSLLSVGGMSSILWLLSDYKEPVIEDFAGEEKDGN